MLIDYFWAALFIAARCFVSFRYAHAYLLVALQTYAIAVVVVAQSYSLCLLNVFRMVCHYYAIHGKSNNNNTKNAIVYKRLQRQFGVLIFVESSNWTLITAVGSFFPFLIFYYIYNEVDCVDFRKASRNFATYAKSN